MATILCLETSAALCTVAIVEDEGQAFEVQGKTQQSHAKELVPLMQQCLEQRSLSWKDLDALAISDGPGSFTGLRVGAATAKGVCFAHDIPLIAVDTILSIVKHAAKSISAEPRRSLHYGLIDARRKEVYLKGFDDLWNEIAPLQAFDLDTMPLSEYISTSKSVIVSGDSAHKLASLPPNFQVKEIYPRASLLAPLALSAWHRKEFVEVNTYSPSYLKPPNITAGKPLL